MIENEKERRWWFANHPEYAGSSKEGRKHPNDEGQDGQQAVSPESVDAYVDEALKYLSGPEAALLKSFKRNFGTEAYAKEFDQGEKAGEKGAEVEYRRGWKRLAQAGAVRAPDIRLRPEDMAPFLKELAALEFKRAVGTGLSTKSDLDRLAQSIKEKLVDRMPRDDRGQPQWPSITVNWKTKSELARDKAKWVEENGQKEYEMTVQEIGEFRGEPLFVVYKYRVGLELRKEFNSIDLINRTGDGIRKLFR